jgi:dipeptidyl aminopeptidase/acylaminoacyl peptidase
MRLMRRRIGLAILATIIIAFGTYLFAGIVIYDKLSIATTACATSSTSTPADFTIGGLDTQPYRVSSWRTVTIPSRDPGISLHGWHLPAAGDRAAPAVIVVHGHSGCTRQSEVLLAAGMLHRNGISALLIDMRDHGGSTVEDGRFAGGTEEHRDVLGAWDWLVASGFDPSRVGLMGFSLGAATVLIAAGQESRVAAVWEDSSYADVGVAIRAELARNSYPTWFEPAGYLVARIVSGDDLGSLSPIGAVERLGPRPLFITHGDADARLSVQYAHDLAAAYRANGGTVDPWIVPGSGHTRAIFEQPAEYERRLAVFFAAALGGPDGVAR